MLAHDRAASEVATWHRRCTVAAERAAAAGGPPAEDSCGTPGNRPISPTDEDPDSATSAFPPWEEVCSWLVTHVVVGSPGYRGCLRL